jgi:hypothetical protein
MLPQFERKVSNIDPLSWLGGQSKDCQKKNEWLKRQEEI